MDPIEEQAEKVTVNFQYFIQMAIEKKMAWSTLAHLLTDLAATPEISKQVIKLLLQELEKWVSKVENEPKIDVEFPSTNKELQETEKVFHEIEVMEEGEETERTFPEYTLIANDKQCDLETKSEHKIIQREESQDKVKEKQIACQICQKTF